eukprot:gene14257-15744_t
MNLNQNVTFGNPSTISKNTSQQHNVMQPTSPLHGYPPGTTSYHAYGGSPTALRLAGVSTNHWRPGASGYTSQATNWNQGQVNPHSGQSPAPGNPLFRHSTVPQVPVTSNTVHYHGDQLPVAAFNPSVHSGQNKQSLQSWSASSSSSAHLIQNVGPLGVQQQAAISSDSPHIKQEQKSEDEDFTDPNLLRQKVLEYYMSAMESLRVEYRDMLQELFFLQNGGNLVDYHGWRKRPNPQMMTFLNASRLDNEMSVSTPTATNTVSPAIQVHAALSGQSQPTHMYGSNKQIHSEHADSRHGYGHNVKSAQHRLPAAYPSNYGFTNQFTTSVPPATSQLSWSASNGNAMTPHVKQEASGVKNSSYADSPAAKGPTPGPSTSFFGTPTLSSMYASPLGTQEDIALQARKEQDILQKIAELRKEGLWSASRLPKVHEPPRKKAHWDYLLEEMQWLATDFSQERKWKRNMARKLSKSVMKYHHDKKMKEQRVKKEESARLKRIASCISKEIKQFWQSVEKVAQYKQQSRLEERRKKALDLHLNFIVGQTEKYSSWLVEGFKSSEKGSTVSSPRSTKHDTDEGSDVYQLSDDGGDDEETIEKEEKDEKKYTEEIEALKRESEMSLDDILDSLPAQMIKDLTSGKKAQVDDDKENEDVEEMEGDDQNDSDECEDAVDDDEFDAMDESDADDEQTLDEQEKKERGQIDHKEEIHNLEKEGDMPLSELLKLYDIEQSELGVAQDEKNEDEQSESLANEDSSDDNEEGTEALLEPAEDQPDKDENLGKVPDEMLNDVAATAESLQPKGFTLSTTEVKTAVPFLLYHKLREYQHIGLDWLVTMYDKQLNGILADEMGLGKTIETIALLAHLACEKKIWGPHLIVVPTSVMLNWEYEFKKWLPAFKILTYYGTQKERKLKRTGWSKPNAFHICITSYKLVIQDHQAFRRRKWKYLILDEAQNIKNFKSQRWQTLLNFNSQRRLLLTGTPLQNHLMELWSLMHFLMPHLFSSHQDFKEWFSNPLTGMIEGSQEYNESIVMRLHKVLRPFLLRRLKSEVETQMPKKYEHVVRCYLSKRQRYLYEEFMSRTKTKETLANGNFMSVINILMQLRKVCNHPDLFETRPTISPFIMDTSVTYRAPSEVLKVIEYDAFERIDLKSMNFCLIDMEMGVTAFASHRTQEVKVTKALIEEICSLDHHDQSCTTSDAVVSNSDVESTSVAMASNSKDNMPQIENSNSCDGNEIDVVGDEDMEESLNQEVAVDHGRLLDRYVSNRNAPFFLTGLEEKNASYHKDRIERIARINDRHCAAQPIYGTDLCAAVLVTRTTHSLKWNAAFNHQNPLQNFDCNMLKEAVKTSDERLKDMNDIFERFVLVVPAVEAAGIDIHVSHPSPSWLNHQRRVKDCLDEVAVPIRRSLWNIEKCLRVQFPETRLIQYDCGKLQTLHVLLRMLKAGKHRILIFTQMTKMLDVLERFLTYHGYIYLRLDGTTKVEQRQILMERFNQDSRIFCFILSTRSGGIGVNLTGADTVIFYDSDWNPTMDAQAQDRCHRIGQTRDVHIYRLICEKTVEENILKKADEKRLLGDIAIEGGNFNTAFFKKNTLRDLFDVKVFEQAEQAAKVATVPKIEVEVKDIDSPHPVVAETKGERKEVAAFEQALFNAEDEQDVRAASTAKAEQVAEMAEFNENVPIKTDDKNDESKSKVEEELAGLENELSPIERYALKYLEATSDYLNIDDELEDAERQVESAKKDWELEHLQAKKEAEERKHAVQEDDMFFTYARDDDNQQQQQVPKHNKSISTANDLMGSRRSATPVPRRIRSRDGRLSRENIDVETGGSPCSIDVTMNRETIENGLTAVDEDDRGHGASRILRSPRKKAKLESERCSRRSSRCSSRTSSRSSSANRLASTSNNTSPAHSPTRETRKTRSTSLRRS